MRTWFRIAAQADPAVADVYIYDVIGASWFDESVSAKQFLDTITALPDAVKTLRLHVNSPGGDPFDATAIHNLLRAQATDKGRTVEVLIEGIAASAATVVTSAGDSIKIARNALMMVHNPYGLARGTANDMLEMAQALEAVRDSIVASYQRISSLSAAKLKALMDATTWMDAEAALANGFATEITEPAPVAALFDPRSIRGLGEIPERFRERVAAFVRAQSEDWKVGGDRSLPLDDNASWDSGAADARVQKWASSDGSGDKAKIDWAKYQKSQIVYDANNREAFGGYKLGFADVIGGSLKAVRAGLIACRVVLNGGRGGVNLPADVITAAKAFVDSYLGKQKAEADAEPAAATDVLAAVEAAGLSATFARELIEAKATMGQVTVRIAESILAKKAAGDREKEIRALCAAAKCPELVESYLRSGIPVAEVKTQLTIVTAKLDKDEIDTALLPDGRPKKGPRIDTEAVYAEYNRLTPKEG